MSTKSVRNQILDSYLRTIQASFQEDRPQLKLINYGTGSGKTHQLFQAIYQTIKKHPDSQIIGIYIAPLREHLSVPKSLKSQYPHIPVYKLNSLEMKTTDELIENYKDWIPSILNNRNLWNIDENRASREKVEENQAKLQQVRGVFNRLEYVRRVGLGDDKFNQSEITKAKREVNNLLEGFLEFFIKCKFEQTHWPAECLNLMEIFFPLHLLREKSGILLLTYKKFETQIPYFKWSNEQWVKQSEYLDKYAIAPANNSNTSATLSARKFIFALDEQEDGYQIMLQEKIKIVSPEDMAINNALSSIKREFSLLFSTQNQQNRALLNFLEKNTGAYEEFQEVIEKGKRIYPGLEKYLPIYQRLTSEEGNSREFLQEVIKIYKGIDKSLEEIVELFQDFDEEDPIELDWEVLSRVLSKFENNRSLLIPQELYNENKNNLMNIFCYNDLYVYNIELLKKLFLVKPAGGHVRIMEYKEKKVSEGTSVAQLIYTIFAMGTQIKKIKDILVNVLGAEDSQSRSLEIWSRQIDKVKKANEERRGENPQLKYLNRAYVYESNKSMVNLKEISRYQHPDKKLIDPALTEVAIGSTVIFTSPEEKIKSILAKNANVLFLISATGGITGDLSTSYDFIYLEDELRSTSGQSYFQRMTQGEVSLCEQIRESRESKREITVNFFNQDLSSFPNQETQEVVARFEELILKDFIEDNKNRGLHRYKIQELKNFIRFLFYLLEDKKIQETIAFTQTLRFIKPFLEYCERLHHANFTFEQAQEHPNIYFLKVNHTKYQSKTPIKIVLYEASFNKLYNDKTTQKSYLDELVEEEGQKIFFISAYQSASKGLNPIVKTQNGEEKDFDSLILLTDSYYTMMEPSKAKKKRGKDNLDQKSEDEDEQKSTTLQHFAIMKSIVSVGDSQLEIKEFNQYLSGREAGRFKAQQHQILLGKAIVQAIGRSERRDFPNQVSKIFLNEETRKNLVNLYNYLEREEPDEIRKLSLNNDKVYLRVREDEKKRCIKNYDDHVDKEMDAASAFNKHKTKMLEEIESFKKNPKNIEITRAWEALRDPIAFRDPKQYLAKLEKSQLFCTNFIESLFYHNSQQPEFTPYLAWEEENGEKFQIISDSINGEKTYDYQKRLYPESLKTNGGGYDLEGNEIELRNDSTQEIYRLYRELIPDPEIFNRYIPRPHFFNDIFYPSLTENFVERWIEDVIFQGKDWDAIKDLYGFEQFSDFKNYNQLYELFDLFYLNNDTLFCIDVKAWSKASGNRLSQETVEKTKEKLNTIVSDYPEFATVRGLLLNLHGTAPIKRELSSTLWSGNLIYFDDSNCPVESKILRNFLFQAHN